MKVPWLLLSFGVIGVCSRGTSCVIAKTESGLVCGVKKKAVDGEPFVSFLGIPYAKAPLAELRFAEPEKPDPFIDIFNATTAGPICPQHTSQLLKFFMRPVSMSEDCLHVNVHVPLASLPDPEAIGSRPLLPVLAFVHGGSFSSGSADPDSYGPEFLMSKGVILVTINYRLGVFGFFSLNSKRIPGNAALRDVLFALKWVKRNIGYFWGDPAQVTLGGMSAGSAVAHLVAISPAVKGLGLFQRVILMSGTAIANFFSTSPVKRKLLYRPFLEAVGINPSQSPEKIYKELINAPLQRILDANDILRNSRKTGVSFEPVIDHPQKGFTTMIPKDPEELIKDGNAKEYPTLFGFTTSECSIYKHRLDKLQLRMRRLPPLTVPQNVLLSANLLTIPMLVDMVSREYFNHSLSTTNKYLKVCSDALYKYPVLRTVEKRLEVGANTSFVYEFGYEMPSVINVLKEAQEANWTGVGHTEDMSFVFRTNSVSPEIEENELEQNNTLSKMRLFMTNSISNFVKFGYPGAKLSDWPETGFDFELMSVRLPQPRFLPLSTHLVKMKRFLDKLYRIGGLR